MIQDKKVWSVCLFFAVAVGGCGSDDSKNQTQNEPSTQQVAQQDAAKAKAKESAAKIKAAAQTRSAKSRSLGRGKLLRNMPSSEESLEVSKKRLLEQWEKLQEATRTEGEETRDPKQDLEEIVRSKDLKMMSLFVKEVADVVVPILVGNPVGAVFEGVDFVRFAYQELKPYLKDENMFTRMYAKMEAMLSKKSSRKKAGAHKATAALTSNAL
ncbi:MAG: hypothetical protein AAF320_06830 [Myxococcota bacterium]